MQKPPIYKILKLYKNNSDIPTYEVYPYEDNEGNRIGQYYTDKEQADVVCEHKNRSPF